MRILPYSDVVNSFIKWFGVRFYEIEMNLGEKNLYTGFLVLKISPFAKFHNSFLFKKRAIILWKKRK